MTSSQPSKSTFLFRITFSSRENYTHYQYQLAFNLNKKPIIFHSQFCTCPIPEYPASITFWNSCVVTQFDSFKSFYLALKLLFRHGLKCLWLIFKRLYDWNSKSYWRSYFFILVFHSLSSIMFLQRTFYLFNEIQFLNEDHIIMKTDEVQAF